MEKISCKEARKLGLKYYFTGKPCVHGHIAPRLTYKWACVECATIYQKEFLKKNPDWRTDSNRHRAPKQQRLIAWADKDFIKRIYVTCKKITKQTGIKHQVDHIIPIKGDNVCGLHVHNNLAIITAKMNLEKGNRFAA